MRKTYRSFSVFSTICFAFALPLHAFAQEPEPDPIATDRPDFTETAEAVPKGMTQVEGGYSFTKTGDDKSHSFGELLFRISIGQGSELRVGLNSLSWTRGSNDDTGLEDTSLGVKFELSEGSGEIGLGAPQVALIAETSLPTGSSGFGESKLQPELKLCLGWDLSEQVSLGSNLNFGLPVEGGERFSQFTGTLALGVGLTERLSTFIEYFGIFPSSEDGSDANYMDGGLTYLLTNDFQLDFRVGVGLNSESDDYFIGVGAARRW